jgi:sortase A
MTAPHVEADGTSEESANPGGGGGTLWADFVQSVLSKQGPGTVAGPSEVESESDLGSVWKAGESAPSDEAAIGRVVRAASLAVRRGPTQQRQATSSPEVTQNLNGARSLDERPRPDPQASKVEGAVTQKLMTPPVLPAQSTVPSDQVESLRVDESQSLRTKGAPAKSAPGVAHPISGMPAAAVVVQPLPAEHQQDRPTDRADLVDPEESHIRFLAPNIEDEVTTEGEQRAALDATRRRSAWFHTFTWIRNIGIIILLFVAWQLWGTSISQHHAQSQLKSEFDAKVQAHHAAGGHSSSLIPAATQLPSAPQGSVVAEIQIPAIGVDQYVVEGTAETDLSKGPGHYVGTAAPGQAGNVAIAGHRTTNGAPFNELGHLVPGDRIILTTTSGQHLTYAVSGAPQVVSPRNVSVLNYFGDNRVTLTTCNPEFSSSQRLVVVGQLKGPLGGPTVDAKHVAYHLADPSTASWNWSLLPGLGVVVCLLLLLALSRRQFSIWFKGFAMWLVLVPLWAAGLYLLFDTLTRFLPASF